MPLTSWDLQDRTVASNLHKDFGCNLACIIIETLYQTATDKNNSLGGASVAVDGDYGAGLHGIENALGLVFAGCAQVHALPQSLRGLCLGCEAIECFLCYLHDL